MNDYEVLQSVYERLMDGVTSEVVNAWLDTLPEVRFLCKLMDAAEKTGYISVTAKENEQ